MSFTAAYVWTAGEYVTGARLNQQIRDNLTAILDLNNAKGMGLYEFCAAGSNITVGWGDNIAAPTLATAPEGVFIGVDHDALNAVSPITEMRVRYEIVVLGVAPGSPSVIACLGGVELAAVMGNPSAMGQQYLGAYITTYVNSTGAKTYDSGWFNMSGLTAQRVYFPIWRSDRVGGSGPGSATIAAFTEVRCRV